MNIVTLEKPEGVVVQPRRADGHQPGSTPDARRADHRHRLEAIGRAENRDALKSCWSAGHSPAQGRGRDGYRGRRSHGRAHRLSGAGAPVVRAGRPRHADRARRGGLRHYLQDRRAGQRGPAGARGQVHHRQGAGGRTPSATAETSTCPASWSMSSAPACTAATPSASIPPSRSARRSRTIIDYTGGSAWALASWACTTSSSSWTEDNVSIIEVNPRSSRTVPFPRKATGVPLADIATRVMLGHSLREQGIVEVMAPEKRSGTSRRRPSASPSCAAWTPT